MLRSNSKKAIENIHNYIMDNFSGDNYSIEQPETFKEAAKIIYKVFTDEMLHGYNKSRNIQSVFIEWLSGLPSIIDSCYYYNRSAVDDLAGILEETKEEAARFTESEAEEMLSRLIFREVSKAAR